MTAEPYLEIERAAEFKSEYREDRVQVDLFSRQSQGTWALSSASSLDATLCIPFIDCPIPPRELYARVALTEA